MTMPSTDDAKLLALLNRHPGLKSRVQALADIVEDSDGGLDHRLVQNGVFR